MDEKGKIMNRKSDSSYELFQNYGCNYASMGPSSFDPNVVVVVRK